MPVFDFNDVPEKERTAECTYTTFSSNNSNPTPEQPIMVLDNQKRKWQHHSCGRFTNPVKRTAFEFEEEDGTVSADILQMHPELQSHFYSGKSLKVVFRKKSVSDRH